MLETLNALSTIYFLLFIFYYFLPHPMPLLFIFIKGILVLFHSSNTGVA